MYLVFVENGSLLLRDPQKQTTFADLGGARDPMARKKAFGCRREVTGSAGRESGPPTEHNSKLT